MQQFEHDYAKLITKILTDGEDRETRNGVTRSLFGESILVDLQAGFPVLQGRKMHINGVLGELAAMLRQPKSIADFEEWGCNYWKLWGKADGSITVDYGNAWFDFEGFDQIADLKDKLRNNPTDRRMIVSAWRPHKLSELDLPCCHYSYQFYVRKGRYLDMIWSQRSVDTMIGLPSDFILGAAWLIAIAMEFGFLPGKIKFDLGDCHIYQEHIGNSYGYLFNVENTHFDNVPQVKSFPQGKDFTTFEPSWLELNDYSSCDPLTFFLKE